MNVPRPIAFLLVIAAAAVVAALAILLALPSTTVAPLPSAPNASQREQSSPQLEPVRRAGGKIVSFSGGLLIVETLRFSIPDPNNPAAIERREVAITADTAIFRIEQASAQKLRRLRAAPTDLRPGLAVTVETSGDFLEPDRIVATRVEVSPVGLPILPIE